MPADSSSSAPGSSTFVDWVRRRIWWIGAIGGLLVVTLLRPFLIHRPPPPPVIAEVPVDVTLTDQHGRTFPSQSMHGQVHVVGFMFTRCPSLCPQITQAMQRFSTALDDGGLDEHVALMSVTVDPDHDTPQKLREYTETWGIDGVNWRFVTAGDRASTEAFVVQGFRLAIGDEHEVSPGVFDIAHSSKLALVDREGGIRGFYSIDEAGLEELYHRALAVVRLEDE